MTTEPQAPAGGPNTPGASAASGAPDLQGLQTLQQSIDSLNQNLAPKAPEPMTEAQLVELAKTNPAKALHLTAERLIDQRFGTVEKKFNELDQRRFYDGKAVTDFPGLNSDKDFQQKVKEQMTEMVRDGEYTKDSPKLLYRAATLAAATYKPAAQPTAGAPSGMSGEPPRGGGSPSGGSDDTQFDAYCKTFGIKNTERMRERMKAQKGSSR